jgi:hypothetical protein
MKLFIPACGDRIVLTKAWTFELRLEHRNVKFAHERGLATKKESQSYGVYEENSGVPYGREYKHVSVTFPKGTVLECDRVYIRTFNKAALELDNDFDSITWKVMAGDKMVTRQRFWAKLVDCCEIDCKVESLYRDRVKLIKSVHES